MAISVDIFKNPVFCQPSWVCAATRPGSEFVIAATLELEEVETYLPVCNPIRANTVYRKALFPGYFFAKLCEKRLKLPTIAAIADLICIDDEPVLVRQQVIDELRAREIRGVVPIHAQIPEKSPFTFGLPVRLTQGAHSGLTGVFEGMQGRHRAAVRIGAATGSLRVSVPLKDLIPQAAYQRV